MKTLLFRLPFLAFTAWGQSPDLSKAAGIPPMIDASKTTIDSSRRWLDIHLPKSRKRQSAFSDFS